MGGELTQEWSYQMLYTFQTTILVTKISFVDHSSDNTEDFPLFMALVTSIPLWPMLPSPKNL